MVLDVPQKVRALLTT